MRHRLVIFSAVVFVGVVACVYLMFVRSPKPSATIRIVEYEFRDDSIVAWLALTNDGPCTFAYGDHRVDYRVAAHLDSVTTDYTGHCGIVSDVVFHPHMRTGFAVSLPLRTQNWRCYFPCYLPSARERAVDRIIQSGLSQKRIFPVLAWLTGLLPSGRGSTIEISHRQD